MTRDFPLLELVSLVPLRDERVLNAASDDRLACERSCALIEQVVRRDDVERPARDRLGSLLERALPESSHHGGVFAIEEPAFRKRRLLRGNLLVASLDRVGLGRDQLHVRVRVGFRRRGRFRHGDEQEPLLCLFERRLLTRLATRANIHAATTVVSLVAHCRLRGAVIENSHAGVVARRTPRGRETLVLFPKL